MPSIPGDDANSNDDDDDDRQILLPWCTRCAHLTTTASAAGASGSLILKQRITGHQPNVPFVAPHTPWKWQHPARCWTENSSPLLLGWMSVHENVTP